MIIEQKLLGSDTDGQDAFGHSVSVDEDNELIVVGAPYAEDYGVTEVTADNQTVVFAVSLTLCLIDCLRSQPWVIVPDVHILEE